MPSSIIDVEMLQMMVEFVEPLVVDEETLAIEAMREVQPGGIILERVTQWNDMTVRFMHP